VTIISERVTMDQTMPLRRDETGSVAPSRARSLANAAASVVLVGLAAYSVVYLLSDRVDPVDFHVYLAAAEEIADGVSPYPGFAYPPLSALAAVPFTLVSVGAAELAVKLLLVLGVVAVLAVLGVRDWRCYPLALLWPSVNAAVQTGNVTIPLALSAALAWRLRDRAVPAGLSLGAGIAAKFVLWPLWLWLAAARRWSAAAWTIVGALGVTLLTWALVDFRALLEYPDRLRQVEEATAGDGYTLDALLRDLGLGNTAARGLMAAVAVALLVAVVVVGRRGAEQRSFVLAVAAALACSPILWLHYFALLLLPVAVVRPRLDLVWFVPLGMWWFGAGTGNGTTADAAVVLGVAAATVVLAYRAAPRADREAPPYELAGRRTTAISSSS
jgi:hypothetical protein